MKTLLIFIGLAICAAFMCGCEWTAGSSVDTWNTSQNGGDWADFSGSYKAAGGGVLVRSFEAPTTNSTTTTNQVSGQELGVGDGVQTAFSGNLGHAPVRNTLTIVVGGYRITDSGAGAGTIDLAVTPADGSTGTFNFGTYIWTLSFPAPIAAETPILAAYYYLITTVTTNSVPGNHGKAIYSFIIYQLGNKLQIIDNNGSSYAGTIGTMRLTGEQPAPDPTTGKVTHTGPVEAQFSATGTSQGYLVTIVGVLQGTISGATFSGRRMNATFIEEGGFQGDITASAQ